MSLLDSASLICTPNGYQEGKLYSVIPSDGSGDMSVVRATTATRVNSAGLVELVPYNFIRYSQDFTNGAWVKLGTALTVTGNTTIAPDGTLTADTLNVSNNDNVLYQANSSGFAFTGNTYTFSIYAKGTGTFDMRVRLNSATTTSQVKTLTNEWQRFDVSVTNSVAVTSVESYIVLNTSSTYFVWGAQLVEGSIAKDYQKTEKRLNIPRLDYSNGTCPSLLVEPQRTNIQTYSSSFDNADWGKIDSASIIANDTIAPDGTLSADRLTPANPSSYIVNSTNVFAISNNSYSHSVYAKAGTQSTFGLAIGTPIGSWSANYDLSAVTASVIAGSGTIATIEDAGNGWYRCILTAPIPTVVYAEAQIRFNSATGYIYIWGAQLEVGSYATSYIPTTSASVTRNADVISKTGISSLIGQTEGTLFVDFYNYANNSTIQGTPLCISNGGFYGNAVYFEQYLGSWYCVIWNGVSQQFIGNAGVLSEGYHKLAVAYKTNDVAYYVDGNQIAVDTSATIPTCNQVDIGAVGTSTTPEQLGVKAAALWKTRLTNTQLAALTTI